MCSFTFRSIIRNSNIVNVNLDQNNKELERAFFLASLFFFLSCQHKLSYRNSSCSNGKTCQSAVEVSRLTAQNNNPRQQ